MLKPHPSQFYSVPPTWNVIILHPSVSQLYNIPPSFNYFPCWWVTNSFFYRSAVISPEVHLCVFAFGDQFLCMRWFGWHCQVWLKPSELQTRHPTSTSAKMRGAIVCPQKSDVCKSKRDSALAEDGSAAQKCDKNLVGLQKTMGMNSQENKFYSKCCRCVCCSQHAKCVID